MSTPAQLYIFTDRIFWGSASFSGQNTQRPAPALLLGVNNAIELTLASGEHFRGRALLVQPQVARQVQAKDAGFCSLNLDPSHVWALRMRQAGAGKPVQILDDGPQRAWLQPAQKLLEGLPDGNAARLCTENILTTFWGQPGVTSDPRIAMIAAQLQADMPARLPLEELAHQCELSPSRLRHLFREQTGVPLRSYLLWLKMHQAAALFARDWSMTAVAAEIGFSDASHLCRVFREYFSVNPSWLADADQVRVWDCR